LEAYATTPDPVLIVWFVRETNNAAAAPNASYLGASISDASGFISGDRAPVYVWFPGPEEVRFQSTGSNSIW
jgi:hypothetical protein